MSTVTTNKFKSTTIYGTLNVNDYPSGNIISNTNLTGNLTVNGKINNIPVSTIAYVSNLTSDVQAQIDLKAPINSPTFTGTVGGITKSMVGLSNVDDTTDLLKPVSTATQLALDLKGGLSTNNSWSGTNDFNTSIPTTTLTPFLSSQFITKAYADSNYAGTGILSGSNTWTGTNVYNTNLPTSTIVPTSSSQLTNKTYVDLKAPIDSPTFTGTVITSELTSSGLITANNGLTILNGGINCININNSTDIYSNQYLRNLNNSNSGFCELFTNATINDNIMIGSNVSTTRLTGQSVNIETDLYTTGATSLQATTINGTLTASIIDMYGNYTGMKPINGNYLQFYTLNGFTFNCNTATGFSGSNEALRIDNSAITLNKATTINGTLTTTGTTALQATTINNTCQITGSISAYSAIISSQSGLLTPILNFNDYNGITAYSGAIFQQSNNMTIRSFNDGGTSPAATNIYFITKNSSKVDSNTMILYNNSISLNQPTTITGSTTSTGLITGNNGLTITSGSTSLQNTTVSGNLNVTGSLTVNNIPVISSLASAGFTPTQNSPNTSGLSYTFVVYPYYSDAINVCSPIASAASGSFSSASLNVTHTINSITCQINKNGSFFANPIVTVNATLPLTKTTTITGGQGSGGGYSYNFKQYFINAIINFIPTIENATNTYTVTFTISGAGTFEYNTGISNIYNA